MADITSNAASTGANNNIPAIIPTPTPTPSGSTNPVNADAAVRVPSSGTAQQGFNTNASSNTNRPQVGTLKRQMLHWFQSQVSSLSGKIREGMGEDELKGIQILLDDVFSSYDLNSFLWTDLNVLDPIRRFNNRTDSLSDWDQATVERVAGALAGYSILLLCVDKAFLQKLEPQHEKESFYSLWQAVNRSIAPTSFVTKFEKTKQYLSEKFRLPNESADSFIARVQSHHNMLQGNSDHRLLVVYNGALDHHKPMLYQQLIGNPNYTFQDAAAFIQRAEAMEKENPAEQERARVMLANRVQAPQVQTQSNNNLLSIPSSDFKCDFCESHTHFFRECRSYRKAKGQHMATRGSRWSNNDRRSRLH